MQRALRHSLLCLAALAPMAAAAPQPPAEASAAALLSPYLLQEDNDGAGDSALIRLCRAAALGNEQASAYLEPLITQLLAGGADVMEENADGCSAYFYLQDCPAVLARLKANKLIPAEPLLRIPHEESGFLNYLSTRTAQAPLAAGSAGRAYLIKRFCKPAYPRAELKFRTYLNSGLLYRMPQGALTTCLAFMRLTDAEQAHACVNGLPLWLHGEHFLEEMPAALLNSLTELQWKVNPGKLRLALEKLNSMLPTTQGDMIDCFAAEPMGQLLELLVLQEGERALPDLQRYARSYDPELVQLSLRLQLRLKGVALPDEQEEAPPDPELQQLREVLLTDSALHYGSTADFQAETLLRVADYLAKIDLPEHAEIIRSMVEEGELIVTEASLPSVRARYEELREERPRVRLLRRLLEAHDSPDAAAEQLRLKGVALPDEQEEAPTDPELQQLREVLQTDFALHYGSAADFQAETLLRVADYLAQIDLPEHAEIIRSMVEEGELTVTEASLPSVRARYEELREERPRVRLLRRLQESYDSPDAAAEEKKS